MSHNGGRSQENIDIAGQGALKFINHLKEAQAWQSTSAGEAFPAAIGANGFLASTPTHPTLTEFFVDQSTTAADVEWYAEWTGEGQANIGPADGGGITVVSVEAGSVVGSTANSMTTDGVNGRIKFRWNTLQTQPSFRFNSVNGANPITAYSIHLASHDSIKAQVFHPDYLTRRRALNCGAIRFVGNVGGSNQVAWSQRPQTTDFSYGMKRWVPSAWVGTIAGTDTYTNASIPGSPSDGQIVQGQVTNANTVTNPTLAGKAIKDNGGGAVSVGSIPAADLSTFVFDSALNCWMYWSDGIYSDIPFETAVDLCNTLNAHGHFCVPLLATDDYITQLATTIKGRLRSELRAYVEYCNEVWNFAGAGGPGTGYASQRGLAAGVVNSDNRPYHYWYAKRAAQMADLISTVYGADHGTRTKIVIGVQMAGTVSEYDTYRFKGTDVPQPSPNRLIDKAHGVMGATYFMGLSCLQDDAAYANNAAMTALTAKADDYATGTPSLVAGALSFVDSDVRSAVGGQYTLDSFTGTTWPAWHAKCVTYGKKFEEYEGALAIAAPSTNQLTAIGIDTAYHTKIFNLFRGYRNSTSAKTLTLDHYNAWIAQSQGEFPSQFTIAQRDDGPWAIIIPLDATPQAIYDAIVAFNVSSGLVGISTPVKKRRRKTKRVRYSDLETREAYTYRPPPTVIIEPESPLDEPEIQAPTPGLADVPINSEFFARPKKAPPPPQIVVDLPEQRFDQIITDMRSTVDRLVKPMEECLSAMVVLAHCIRETADE